LEILSREPEGEAEGGPEMRMKEEAELSLAIHWIQQALVSAFEDKG
jgi:hypothetical protein